jgi:hypothetical protein
MDLGDPPGTVLDRNQHVIAVPTPTDGTKR